MAAVILSANPYINTVSVSKEFREKVRDILHSVLKIIRGGKVEKLKKVRYSEILLCHFKARLLEVRIPQDSSPLVVTMLNGHLQMFTYILNDFPTNLEQESLTKTDKGGDFVHGASLIWIASSLGRLEFLKPLVEHGANIEHTTDFKHSPLSIAAFNGHCEVCEF